MNMKKLLAIIVISMFCTSFVYSYDNRTAHREFNTQIVNKFKTEIKNWQEFKNYTFNTDYLTLEGPMVVFPGYFKVTEENRKNTTKEWIREGGYSADEPEAPAAYRHFYDPKALNGASYLTDANKAVALFNPSVDAIYWHIYGSDVESINIWNWHKGKEHMTNALKSDNVEVRKQYLAKAFRSLGEVLHNTADMGCPPHVRNDSHGGFGLGGGDPYESGFKAMWVPLYMGNAPDPTLKGFFRSAKLAKDINTKLAEFTNMYFFSDETISGYGSQTYHSRNGRGDYPSPKLDKLNYDQASFDYTFTFPSGRQIEMCNDKSALMGFLTNNYRGNPRITQKNVETQAKELIPNILEAGLNLVRNFFPLFEITISLNYKDKKLVGEVKHIPTEEYPNAITVGGEVSFWINLQNSNTKAVISQNKFELANYTSSFKKGDKVQAVIYLGEITISSNELIINDVVNPVINTITNLDNKSLSTTYIGDTVAINGSGFGDTQVITSRVYLNDQVVNQILTWSNNKIVIVIPQTKGIVSPQLSKVKVVKDNLSSNEFPLTIANWWYAERSKFKYFKISIVGDESIWEIKGDGTGESLSEEFNDINIVFNGNDFTVSKKIYTKKSDNNETQIEISLTGSLSGLGKYLNKIEGEVIKTDYYFSNYEHGRDTANIIKSQHVFTIRNYKWYDFIDSEYTPRFGFDKINGIIDNCVSNYTKTYITYDYTQKPPKPIRQIQVSKLRIKTIFESYIYFKFK